MNKAQKIMEIFQEWLDEFGKLDAIEQEQVVGESEWWALRLKIADIITAPAERLDE